MSFTLQALNDEIDNDPNSVGYKEVDGVTWKEDSVIQSLINDKNLTLNHMDISSHDIKQTISFDAFNTLQAGEENWLKWVTVDEFVYVTQEVLDKFTDPAESFWQSSHEAAMNTAFLALIEYSGSRAQELWGEGFTVSTSQIGQAANL